MVERRRMLCPQPGKWHEIYQALERARENRQDPYIPKVPVPLILNGWVFTEDWEKELRWKETTAWAERYGFADEIPQIDEEDKYYG